MPKDLEFIFDFGSPNAYMAFLALPLVLARTGARLNITPCLLGGIFKATGNQSPMQAFGGVKGKLEYEALERVRFLRKHNLTRFRFNPHFPVNTLTLMRGAVFASREGFLQTFVEAGLRFMWEEGLKMDDPDVFEKAFTHAGFDGQAILDGATQADVKAQLIANTEAAVLRGVFGIPTFFVGDEMYFGKDRLAEVEAELLAED